MSFKYILYFLLIFSLVGCKQEVVSPEELRQQVDAATDGLKFQITSQNPSSNASATIRVIGIDTGDNVTLFNDPYCANEIANEDATKTILDITATFTSEDTYDLFYIYTDSTNQEGNCNSTKLSYTYDATAPTAATFAFDAGGTTLTDNDLEVLVDITGISTGDYISVHLDSNCSSEVAGFIADSSNVTKELKVYVEPNQINVSTADGSDLDYGDNISIFSDSSCANIIDSKYSKGDDLVFDMSSSLSEVLSFYFIYTDNNSSSDCLELTDYYGYNTNDENLIFSFTASSVNQNLIVDQDYIYYYSVKDSAQNYYEVSSETCHTTGLTYTLDTTAPTAATSITFPATLNIETNNILTATNVDAGDTIRIYSDSNCSALDETATVSNTASSIENIELSVSFTMTETSSQLLNYYFTQENSEGTTDCARVGSFTSTNTANTNLPIFDIYVQPYVLKATNLDSTWAQIEIFKNNGCSVEVTEDSTTDGEIDFEFDIARETVESYYFVYTTFSGASNCYKVSNYFLNNPADNNVPLFRLSDYVNDNENSFVVTVNGLANTDEIDFYTSASCSVSSYIGGSTISADPETVTLTFSTAGNYNIYYKLSDPSGNYGSSDEGECIAADLYYEYDNGNPVDHTMEMVSPTFLLTQDENVALTELNQANGTFTFYQTTPSATLYVYEGEDCTGDNLYTDTVSSSTTDVLLAYNEITENHISYKELNGSTTITSCQNFNFKPLKKDGVENTVEIKFTGLEVGTSLVIYEDTACGGDELYSNTVLSSTQTVKIPLPESYSYVFSSKQIDNAENETSSGCISSNPDGDALEYSYHKVKDLAIGQYHTCAVIETSSTTGKLYCWGRNNNNQLGEASSDSLLNVPGLAAIDEDAQTVSTYQDSVCFVDNAADVYCFGENANSELADGGTTDQSAPVNIASGYNDVKLGLYHGCALSTGNEIACWGYDNYGEVGNNNPGNPNTTPQDFLLDTTPTNYSDAQSIALGDYHSCLIDSDQRFMCWGLGLNGQLGNSLNENIDSIHDPYAGALAPISSTIVYEPGATTEINFTKIDAGIDFTCALTDQGRIMCWGNNLRNQLGGAKEEDSNGVEYVVTNTNKPLYIDSTLTFTDLSVAGDSACAISSSGYVYCWGNGHTNIQQISNSFKYTSVETGKNHSCAISEEGQIHCWGLNNFGQLGNASSISTNTPVITDFDFNRTKLSILNTNNEVISSIDLKNDLTGVLDTILYYSNNNERYETIAGEISVKFTVKLENTSQNDAIINTSSITFSANKDGSDTEDYTDQFRFEETEINGTSAYPGDNGDCSSTLTSGSSCTIVIEYIPTRPRPMGMTVMLNISYSDNDRTYIERIPVTAYSERSLSNIKILDENGNDLTSTLIFNDTTGSVTESIALSDGMTTATITNNTGVKANISKLTFVGEDKGLFSLNGSYPGSGGDCGETLEIGASCDVGITETGSGTLNANLEVLVTPYDTSINATLGQMHKSILLSNNDTTVTVQNPNSYKVFIRDADFIGVDASRFSFNGSTYPGTSGTCESTLDANATCTLNVTDSSPGSLPVAYVELTLEKYTDGSTVDVITSTAKRIITLENTGTENYSFTNVTISGNDADQFKFTGGYFPGKNGTCSASLSSSSTCEIEIEYAPDEDDYQDGTPGLIASLVIAMNDGTQSSLIEIPFHAYSHIYEPYLTTTDEEGNDQTGNIIYVNTSATPAAIVTDTVSYLVTITNTGVDKDNITESGGVITGDTSTSYPTATNISFTISGDDPTEFNIGSAGTCGTRLAAGESCTVEIEYSPTNTTPVGGGILHKGILNVSMENELHDDSVTNYTQDIGGYVDN